MTKLIGYARVSTKQQSTDRQQTDLLAAGVRCDDLYVDHGVSGAQASRPQFNQALDALIGGDTLVITTLDRLGRSTQNMLALADELRARGAGQLLEGHRGHAGRRECGHALGVVRVGETDGHHALPQPRDGSDGKRGDVGQDVDLAEVDRVDDLCAGVGVLGIWVRCGRSGALFDEDSVTGTHEAADGLRNEGYPGFGQRFLGCCNGDHHPTICAVSGGGLGPSPVGSSHPGVICARRSEPGACGGVSTVAT